MFDQIFCFIEFVYKIKQKFILIKEFSEYFFQQYYFFIFYIIKGEVNGFFVEFKDFKIDLEGEILFDLE